MEPTILDNTGEKDIEIDTIEDGNVVSIQQGHSFVFVPVGAVPDLMAALKARLPKAPKAHRSALSVFNLSAGMIAHLVAIDVAIATNKRHLADAEQGHPWSKSLNSHFIVGKRALETRGLIEWHEWTGARGASRISDLITITPMGEQVVKLLKESGTYVEIESTLIWKEHI